MTVTVLTLLKRREGMSKADFIAYYESRHRLIGEKVLSGWASRYVRKHLHPLGGTDMTHDFDVVLEIDFPDQQTCDACFAAMADPAIMDEIVTDEERLFDRAQMRTYRVEECASVLPEVGG
ncbi:EthD domain-containing protein [Novosphingobium sp. MMS21-SN21R]|uniref:EthD domain-containing protein n=1 Tax=Novosphingobium sp. MMS21-SN21R TaxID=2969298 RepID=UPI0028841338|nr:EthD domain-containing protein [Novosphingobium sp. MMS21-SN21R]MDT0510069.1 EthD domain-containing protein [Novosphingobium sp. MMS21-SN21R]